MKAGLTVFIPLYNEESLLQDSVLKLSRYLDARHFPHEILLGSNGSRDRTAALGGELAAHCAEVRFFHLPRRGPGLAFAEALRRAEHDYFVCLDADLSTDLRFIDQAAGLLAQGYDAVVGSKQIGEQRRPCWRVMASDMFIFTTNLLLKMPYRDYSIGAKAYRTEAIRPFWRFIDRHTFYTQELLYQLQSQGRRIIEIPVTCEDRRTSRFNLLHEGIYRYGKLCGLWIRSKRR
jgi:glycosyltransferase involved in cell wall biosynthesis